MKKIADKNFKALLDSIFELTYPLFERNGVLELSSFESKSDLEYFLALLLNTQFVTSENKRERSFGADDVVALKIEIEKNKLLRYWGKINWLSKPTDHKCHRSYQDPFYGLFELNNNRIELVEATFGDYDKNDLDTAYWIESEMNWMYDF